MSKVRSSIVAKLVVVATLILFMVAQHPGLLASAEVVKATVAVKHKPLKHFVAGRRISVEAKVTDSQGVTLVRCYFRAAGQADYVFVGMKAGGKDMFSGILPSPATETKVIEYLFLTVNGKKQVVRTQVFRTTQKDTKDIPEWQDISGDGHVAVSSDMPQATAPAGFADSVVVDVVESTLRFGSVAGIYGMNQVTDGAGVTAVNGTTAAAGSANAVAVSAGMVVASTGISTMVIAGAGVAAIAVGAGLAVAVSGEDGIGGVSGGGSSTACRQYEGNWTGVAHGTRCNWNDGTDSFLFTFSVQANCHVDSCNVGGGCDNFDIEGNTFTNTAQTADDCGYGTMSGVFTSPTSANGTYSWSLGGSGTWTATKR